MFTVDRSIISAGFGTPWPARPVAIQKIPGGSCQTNRAKFPPPKGFKRRRIGSSNPNNREISMFGITAFAGVFAVPDDDNAETYIASQYE
jgi:hypothetical protein